MALPLAGSPPVAAGLFSLTLDDLAMVLLPKLVVLLLFTFPLPVRLCKLGRAPSAFSTLRCSDAVTEMGVGIAECRRALRAALASSLMRVRGLLLAVSAGEESVKSKTARLSFSGASCLIVGSIFRVGWRWGFGARVSNADLVPDALRAEATSFRFAMLVSLMSAEIALEAVDRSSVSIDEDEVFDSWPVSRLSNFCLSGLPTSTSSSPPRPETADTGFQFRSPVDSRFTVVGGAG